MEKLVADTFIKRQNWAYLWINSPKLQFVLLYIQGKDYQHTLKLRCWPLRFNFYKGFLNKEKRSGIILHASFSSQFLKKNISHVIFFWLTKCYCLLIGIFDNMYVVISCCPVCDVINLKLTSAFYKVLFLHNKFSDKFITIFFEKANLFIEFFSKQYQHLQGNNTLPKSNMYHTENRLNDITFDNEKPLKIIQSLDRNKVHRYDDI